MEFEDLKNKAHRSEESVEDLDALLKGDQWTPNEQTPWYLRGPKSIHVPHYILSPGDVSTESDRPPKPVQVRLSFVQKFINMEHGSDFHQIRKIVRILKAADEFGTVLSLALLLDYDFDIEENQTALAEPGGLEILINLISVDSLKCQLGALKLLNVVTKHVNMSFMAINLGIFDALLDVFACSEDDVIKEIASILKNLCSHKKSRTIIRKVGYLPYLLDVIDNVPKKLLHKKYNTLTGLSKMSVDVARDAIQCIAIVSRSPKVRRELYNIGFLKIAEFLLKASEKDVKHNALITIMNCLSLDLFRKSLEAQMSLRLILKFWKDPSKEETILRILFKFAKSSVGREQILKFGALKKIASLIRDKVASTRVGVFKYALGTIYRLGVLPTVRDRLQELNLVPWLIRLLDWEKKSIAFYISGILAFMTIYPNNWKIIENVNGVHKLMDIIDYCDEPRIVANVAKTIGDIAHKPEILAVLKERDALRCLWSLLNVDAPKVQEYAARALVPLLTSLPNVGEEVRDMDRALDLLVSRLDSPDDGVKAGACEALARVTKDRTNLNLLLDMGIVEKICESVVTDSEVLKESIGVLIAGVAEDPRSSFEIGRRGSIKHLVAYLASKNEAVVVSAAYALWKLSYDPINCIALHSAGVVPFLIKYVKSENLALQEAAGGCLFNIRSLAHDAEEIQYYGDLKSGRSTSQYRARAAAFVGTVFFDDEIELN